MRRAELARDIADIDANLARWSRQGVNSTFVAGMRQRREALVAEQARLTASPSGPPVEGSYFINHPDSPQSQLAARIRPSPPPCTVLMPKSPR